MSKLKYGFGGVKSPLFYAKLAAIFTFYKIEDGEDTPLTTIEMKEIAYDVIEYLDKFGINGVDLSKDELHEILMGLFIVLLNTEIDDDGNVQGGELLEFYQELIIFFDEVALAFAKDPVPDKNEDRK